jgi:thiamine pyrophosphokinase
VEGRAIIICNGRLSPGRFLREIVENYELIVCADGGANIAFSRGIIPDIIIGDLDSIRSDVLKYFKRRKVKFIHDTNQENTDIEKAIDYLIEHGYRRIDIISAGGGRFDHMLGNLSVLWKYHGRADLRIIDRMGEVKFITGSVKMEVEPGDIISLLPLGEKADIIRTVGLKYKLKDEPLYFNGRGISNVAINDEIMIEVKRGGLFVFRIFKKMGRR